MLTCVYIPDMYKSVNFENDFFPVIKEESCGRSTQLVIIRYYLLKSNIVFQGMNWSPNSDQ